MEKQVIKLTEEDLHNIIRESVYQILEQKGVVNEGWKNWAMAGALGAATMFGNPQTANAQNQEQNHITQQSRYTPNDVNNINLQIIELEAEANINNDKKVEELKKQRDFMVNTFSKSDKTINFGEDKNSVLTKLSICGWWSKHGTSFSEEGKIEKIYFDAFYPLYVGEYEIDEGQDYELIFFNGKLKNIDTAKNYGEKMKQKVNHLFRKADNIGRGVSLQSSPKKEKMRRSENDDMYFK